MRAVLIVVKLKTKQISYRQRTALIKMISAVSLIKNKKHLSEHNY